jgi:ABC-2 type transport system permease protein
MLKNVFLKTLRDQRRVLMFWGIGLAALSLYITLFYPTVRNMPELNKLLEQMPKGLAAIWGGQLPNYTSPEGFFNMELFSMMLPILFIVFALGFGSGAIAGEEEKGTLDFLLANPVPRWRVVVEKFGVMIVSMLVLAIVFLIGMIIGTIAINVDISLLHLAEATLSTLLLGLVFGTLALFLGCLRGNRGMSLGIASAVAVITYFLNSLGGMVDALKPYRLISPFYHHLEPNTLVNGLAPLHILVMVGLVVVFFALSIPAFQRRDMAV